LTITVDAENTILHRVTFFAFYLGIQDHGAILTLEAGWMEVFPHSSEPGCRRLSLLGDNSLTADVTDRRIFLCVILRAIHFLVLITCEWYSHHILLTNLTVETFWMKVGPCDFNHFSFDALITLSAIFNLILVIFFAENFVIECVICAIDFLFTDTASLLTLLKVLFTYWLAHEGLQ